jgi:S-adenosyl-L-methionine hydrolase (adenosine-forming)
MAATMRPLITLTTDFGLRDPFVGVMKGVIAGICPSANVVDLAHGIEAFDILDGALAIWQAWRYFPAETIHTIVVDPGVGSERRAVLARLNEYWFIAPDNGVLTLVERDVRRAGGETRFWKIENPAYRLPQLSNTFHGRDIFAPAAAHLAVQMERGRIDAASFGQSLDRLIQLNVPEPVHHADGSIEGVILKSDKFGNLLTNIPAADLPVARGGLTVEIGGRRITRFCRFYAEADQGELFGIAGSSGLLEIAMNRGSAQKAMGIASGMKLRLIPIVGQ